MKNTAKIDLEGMTFHSYHGCLEHEKIQGNRFVVDFEGELDICAAAASDALEDTADYGKVYSIVAEEMEKPSNLLENIAARIAGRIETEIPEFITFSVRVSKQNPPVSGACQWSRVTVRGGKE